MKTLLLLILSVVASVTGCTRLVSHDAQRHSIASDGNLYAHHFEGDQLNASGLAKIDAIPRGGPAIIVIHPTRATDRQVFVRRARDVRLYVKQRGLVEAQVRFAAEYTDAEPDAFGALETTSACVADDNR